MLELSLPVILAWFHIAKWIVFGGALVLVAGIIGWIFPPLRRIAIELAIVFACGTYLYGHGVMAERALCQARERAAEVKAQQRDDAQGQIAGADARDRRAALDAQVKTDKEQIDALRQADASCHPITADQLR